MRHFGPKLYVHAEAAVERIAWAGSQAERELALKHKNGCSWGIRESEKFEYEGRGDLFFVFCQHMVEEEGGDKCTWYGVLLIQTSKFGNSVLITSPRSTSRRCCSGFP